MNREKVIKKFPFLLGRSDKSIEKTADSFMNLSNKIWTAIYVSFVVIPLAGVIKAMFDDDQSLPTFEQIIQFFEVNVFLFIGIIILGGYMAIQFRKWALDLYDVLQPFATNKN